jgi:hypothetical protein
MKIILEELSDGKVACSATEDLMDSKSCTKALGMIELAKIALLCGRWGVTDGQGMTSGWQDLLGAYREAFRRAALHTLANMETIGPSSQGKES